MNNSAYIDTLAFICYELTEKDILPNFPIYYGFKWYNGKI